MSRGRADGRKTPAPPPQAQGENWALLTDQARKRYELEQAERGYGDPSQTPLFALPDTAAAAAGPSANDIGDAFFGATEPTPEPTPEAEPPDQASSGVDAGAQFARMEAHLTLTFMSHDKLLASGIDPASPRLQTLARACIRELHAYEEIADPRHWRRMQLDGRRPTLKRDRA